MALEPKKNPMAPGLEITIPGHVVCCPELSLGQRRHNKELLDQWDATGKDAATVEKLAQETVLIALRRNYPEVTEEDVLEFTMTDLLNAAQYALAGQLRNQVFKPLGEAAAASTNGVAAIPAAA